MSCSWMAAEHIGCELLHGALTSQHGFFYPVPTFCHIPCPQAGVLKIQLMVHHFHLLFSMTWFDSPIGIKRDEGHSSTDGSHIDCDYAPLASRVYPEPNPNRVCFRTLSIMLRMETASPHNCQCFPPLGNQMGIFQKPVAFLKLHFHQKRNFGYWKIKVELRNKGNVTLILDINVNLSMRKRNRIITEL